jgi:hypothetical protein
MAFRPKFAVMLVVGVVSLSFSTLGFGACPDSPDHFTFTSNTGCTYSLVINAATIGGVALEEGDEVGVFDGDVCVGAVCWGTPPVGLTAWCDDTQTTPVDGYVCGNAMSFKIWDNSASDYCDPAEATYSSGDGNFCTGFAAILTLACGAQDPVCDMDTGALDFNVATIGGSDSQTFTITNVGGGTLAGSVSETCDEFTVSPGSYSLGAGEFETFTVTYTPTDCGDDLCVIDTDALCDVVECTGFGPSAPICEVIPTELAFSVATIGGSDTKTFTITNIGCGQLMGDVTEMCDEFGVSPEVYDLGPGEFETFTVTYTPEDCGDDQCTIDTDEACTDVVCTATGPNTPKCEVIPTALAFNVGTIGGSDAQCFTVTNIGCGQMSGDLTESCAEFTILPENYDLGPGESQVVTVTYSPVDCGDDGCTIDTGLPCEDLPGDVVCTATGPSTPICEVSPTNLSFNVGTIGGSDSRNFTITNIGCGVLTGSISWFCDEFEVYPTVRSLVPNGYSLGPGESMEFTVTYTPADCGDDQCEIDTDVPCANVMCTTTGPGCPDCAVDPTSLIFSVPTIGGSDSKTFTITNVGGGVLAGSVTESCDEFTVTPGSYNLGPGEFVTFTVTYTPMDCGDDQCEIETGADCANVMCGATGPNTPVCAVVPTTLNFSVTSPGGSDSLPFTITNTGCGQLVGDLFEECDEFDVVPGSYNLGPGQSETFMVTYTPEDCGNDQCTIDTGLPCEQAGDVVCNGAGPGCPACAVDPTSLTFNVPTIGGSDSQTFTIMNVGGGILSGTVTESCDEFTVAPGSYNLAPGEYVTFTVTYTPQDAGDDQCTIDTDLPCVDVTCDATGPACVPTHFTYDTNTDQTYEITINMARIGGRPLAFGDEVGVFVGPTCVGAVCWAGPPVTLTAWINDDQCGLPMYFKVWDTKWGRLFAARAFYNVGDRLLCTTPPPVVRLSVHYDMAGGGLRGRPNPLNPDTEIAYSLPGYEARYTSLKIYNPLGQLVRVLVDEAQAAGEHVVRWDGNNSGGIRVSSGVYFAVLRSGEIHDIEKLMVVK